MCVFCISGIWGKGERERERDREREREREEKMCAIEWRELLWRTIEREGDSGDSDK